MAGIFDYKRYINIFATAEDVKQTFPRDQYTLTWNMNDQGTDGWSCDIDWMTLVVDRIRFVNDEPNFKGSSIIGYFPGSTTSTVQSGTAISLPANMYEGPLYPSQDINVPITMVNINWYKDSLNFQRQFMLIQNWEPGSAIGNPEDDPNYTPITESFPIYVNWYLNTTTVFTNTTILVTASATSTQAVNISNTVSTVLVPPKFQDIPNAILTTTNFFEGAFTATFYVSDDWVEERPLLNTSTYTILTSTLTSSSYTIVADITRQHPIRLEWKYDKSTGFRGGKSTSTTLTVSTTRTVTYQGQPIELVLTQNVINQKIGNTSTFTITHNANETEAITGSVTLSGTVFYNTATSSMPITLGTSTFNSNKQVIFNAVLNTGTYTLQAFYSGNVALKNIFRTMYLATASNSVTHYVEFGREFALTEMLIDEYDTYDILYAHAIDDGRSTGEIGGLVTFYQNNQNIGTSTFVRHYYDYPLLGNVQNFYGYSNKKTYKFLGPLRATYPWPFDPRLSTWQFNSPYGAQIEPRYYNGVNTNTATFFSLFDTLNTPLQNSADVMRNWVGIISEDGSDDYPFAREVGLQVRPLEFFLYTDIQTKYTTDSIWTIEPIKFILKNYVGTINLTPSAPQTININSGLNTNATSITYNGVQYDIYTAPNKPASVGSADIIPKYDNSSSTRGQNRANGTKYFVTRNLGSNKNTKYWLDMGDVWPNTYTGSASSTSTLKVQVWNYEISYRIFPKGAYPPEYDTLYPRITLKLPPPDFRYTATNYLYDYQVWNNENRDNQDLVNDIFNRTYDFLIKGWDNEFYGGGNQFVAFATTQFQPILGTTSTASRSHMASLQVSKGVISTTGSFTATFAGTLNQGAEGYYSTGINFISYVTSTVSVNWIAGGLEYANPYDTTSTQLRLSRVNYLTTDNKPAADNLWKHTTDYSQLAATPTSRRLPTINTARTSWMNVNSYLGSTSPYQTITQGSVIDLPVVEVYSNHTGTVIPNVLTPGDNRPYASGNSQNYVKRLGWLKRRTPQGSVAIRLLDANNTNTVVASLTTNNLTKQETTSTYYPLQKIPNTEPAIYIDPYLQLPAPLRYSGNPWRSVALPGADKQSISRMDMLGLTSYSTATTATIQYPIRLDYIPSVGGIEASQQTNRVVDGTISGVPNTIPLRTSITYDRGSWHKFSIQPSLTWPNTNEKYLIWEGVMTLDYYNHPEWGYTQGIYVESDYVIKASVGVRSVLTLKNWRPRFMIERWSADGSTFIGRSFAVTSNYNITTSTQLTDDGANIDMASSGQMIKVKTNIVAGTPIPEPAWATYYENFVNQPTQPPSQYFTYKVYLVLEPVYPGGPPRQIWPEYFGTNSLTAPFTYSARTYWRVKNKFMQDAPTQAFRTYQDIAGINFEPLTQISNAPAPIGDYVYENINFKLYHLNTDGSKTEFYSNTGVI